MIRQKTEQYVCVCIWAMLLAIGSVVLADQKLLQFIMEESYKITERDLLNVIFMTDQFGIFFIKIERILQYDFFKSSGSETCNKIHEKRKLKKDNFFCM